MTLSLFYTLDFEKKLYGALPSRRPAYVPFVGLKLSRRLRDDRLLISHFTNITWPNWGFVVSFAGV